MQGGAATQPVHQNPFYSSGPSSPQGQDPAIDGHGSPFSPSSPNGGGMPMSQSGYAAQLSSFAYQEAAASGVRQREPYPAWTVDKQIPLSKEEIEDIFIDLANKFGFQRDNMRNMYDHLMILLDSRASRMSPQQALLTLHADYIGGEHANYRKWYFAAQLDLDDAIGKIQNPGLARAASMAQRSGAPKRGSAFLGTKSLENARARWRDAMYRMSDYDRIRQLALYLMCWGEGSQVRFVPECLCFIFKCADDYYRSPECQNRLDPVPEGLYLHSVVKPLYTFLRDQVFEIIDGKFVKKERDHDRIIGYDDVNQLFWYPEGISRIKLANGMRLVDVPPQQRYMKFDKIDWRKAFFKTYRESRSFLHLLVNFNRIWIFHVALYWYFMAYNAPKAYEPHRSPTDAQMLSASALGGAVSTFFMICATVVEVIYIPTTWNNTNHLIGRLIVLGICMALMIAPSVYIFGFNRDNHIAYALSVAQMVVSSILTAIFAILPTGYLFGDRVSWRRRKYMASQTFTASYARLPWTRRFFSILLWVLVFGCKLTESYFFLSLSFKDPFGVLVTMRVKPCHDRYFGTVLCSLQPTFALSAMMVMDLCLFFLDTFLWYVVWSTVFSLGWAFYLGLSVWTPWSDIFQRLPKRIYSKLLATADMEIKYKPKVLVSQVWNAIIISMYREHLLSIDHVQRLLYHQAPAENSPHKRTLRAPPFFLNQLESGSKPEFFPKGSEAERRISFFAQSLMTSIPEPLPVDAMPTFSVLTPHYSEKILLSLREIIREEDQNTRVTLLEYLKQLHPVEWDNFVKDTKILAEESGNFAGGAPFGFEDEKSNLKGGKSDDLPFYCIGFKSAAPEYTLRTRIWSSLRAQTLYRTVSGFMNYNKAIKLLYRVENPEIVQLFGGNTERLERELERMSRRKFKFVISMQRYSRFNKEEIENTEFLLRAYPDLLIAYLDEEPPSKEGGESRWFSALVDGHCEPLPNGRRRPKFRIELPGNPILGDGKSDNQNHAIIFHRGEFLQLIDANQDNYLEECLKIRNVLSEFETIDMPTENPYGPGYHVFDEAPVAIVGSKEYIFSENIGILGDVAAGKEQTFGTLAARGMAQIGGKFHYGHPDFLNSVYMTTRGGVSKAQKGLHLNEDIYAGMMVFQRGGRIKHSEYYQCGKGRDLGFGTILNFITKLGNGMGEQILSREYYYLGTQLPVDRFLTFYYGHPGFHINNIMVILAVQLFMFALMFIGSLYSTVDVCPDTDGIPFVLGSGQCYYLNPVVYWVQRTVISILLVFMIAFLPLFLQELSERGAISAFVRLLKQFVSMSPLFEIFTTQIYSNSIITNLTFGGARYIATGRGFATTRLSFALLYSRFAGPSIYSGIRYLLMLFYATLTVWMPHLIYFWVSLVALCVAPFLFNPHQFAFSDFIIDYREFLRWMGRGNSRSHANSWIGYCRLSRTRITGYKKKRLGHPSEKLVADLPRASLRTIIFHEILAPIMLAVIFAVAYAYVKSFPAPGLTFEDDQFQGGISRLAIIVLVPIAWNAVVLLTLFFVSLFFGPSLHNCCAKFGSVIAGVAHALAVAGLIATLEFFWYIEYWNTANTVLGIIAMIAIQRAIFKVLTSVVISREFKHDETNRAWWTGRWYGRGLGGHAFSQPLREFIVKIIEMSMFTADFITAHLLLFALSIPLVVPFIDMIHSISLFWLRPSKQIHAPIYSLRQRAQRRSIVLRYSMVFLFAWIVFLALILVPVIVQATAYSNGDKKDLCHFCRTL